MDWHKTTCALPRKCNWSSCIVTIQLGFVASSHKSLPYSIHITVIFPCPSPSNSRNEAYYPSDLNRTWVVSLQLKCGMLLKLSTLSTVKVVESESAFFFYSTFRSTEVNRSCGYKKCNGHSHLIKSIIMHYIIMSKPILLHFDCFVIS